VIGTVFEASFSIDDRHPASVLPHITGTAYVSAEATLIFDHADPLRWGIKSSG
jgi:4-hydroxyproline epimerase